MDWAVAIITHFLWFFLLLALLVLVLNKNLLANRGFTELFLEQDKSHLFFFTLLLGFESSMAYFISNRAGSILLGVLGISLFILLGEILDMITIYRHKRLDFLVEISSSLVNLIVIFFAVLLLTLFFLYPINNYLISYLVGAILFFSFFHYMAQQFFLSGRRLTLKIYLYLFIVFDFLLALSTYLHSANILNKFLLLSNLHLIIIAMVILPLIYLIRFYNLIRIPIAYRQAYNIFLSLFTILLIVLYRYLFI